MAASTLKNPLIFGPGVSYETWKNELEIWHQIHLIPKWTPFKYSFVFIQISPGCLVLKLKIQNNILSSTRQQGPICIRIYQWPFWNKAYDGSSIVVRGTSAFISNLNIDLAICAEKLTLVFGLK